METFLDKMRFLIVGVLIIACLLLLPFLVAALLKIPTAQAATTNSTDRQNTNINENPNIITQGMFRTADEIGQFSNSAEQAVSSGLRSATSTIAVAAAQTSKVVASSVDISVTFVANGISNGANLVADGTSSSFRFAVETTGDVIGFVADAPPISAVIRPADKVAVPVIDANAPALAADHAHPHQPTTQTTPQPFIDSGASWPMRGQVTTEFGVPHWPYQPTHTGIDISDGRRSGATPIKPFKPGRVVETTLSKVGLGNYVVVDHGGGMTSVYAHLSSISTQVSQEVTKTSVLGYAGSTGASTGTHLHFEIKINGQYVDPRKYINGQP